MTVRAVRFASPLLLMLLVSVALSLLTGCYMDNEEDLYPDDPTVTCDTMNVTYSGIVKPIMAQNCAYSGCHAGSAPAGGYNLETYAGVQNTVTSGRLVGTITHASGFSPMPKNLSKLPDCSIAQISAWVNAGAPDN